MHTIMKPTYLLNMYLCEIQNTICCFKHILQVTPIKSQLIKHHLGTCCVVETPTQTQSVTMLLNQCQSLHIMQLTALWCRYTHTHHIAIPCQWTKMKSKSSSSFPVCLLPLRQSAPPMSSSLRHWIVRNSWALLFVWSFMLLSIIRQFTALPEVNLNSTLLLFETFWIWSLNHCNVLLVSRFALTT